MKKLLLLLLKSLFLTPVVFAAYYSYNQNDINDMHYQSCFSGCSLYVSNLTCMYSNDDSKKHACERNRQQKYNFCVQQCNERYR